MSAPGARAFRPDISRDVWGWGPLQGIEMWGDRATAGIDHICIFGFPGCAAEAVPGLSRADRMRSAMSVFEMAKLAGSTGAASGGSISRRRSQARSSCRSRRSAARRNASANRWRWRSSSRAHAFIVRSNNGSARGISQPFKTARFWIFARFRQMKLKNRELQRCRDVLAATSFTEGN